MNPRFAVHMSAITFLEDARCISNHLYVHVQVNDESFFFRENERTRHRVSIVLPLYLTTSAAVSTKGFTHRYR